MMFWTDYHVNGWGWLTMGIGMVAVWALVIALTFALVRALDQRTESTRRRPLAEDLLAERFAAGEITEEEYRQRRAALATSDRVGHKP